jgi:hypothetical protein
MTNGAKTASSVTVDIFGRLSFTGLSFRRGVVASF